MASANGLAITGVQPDCGVPGGDLTVTCRGFVPGPGSRVLVGDAAALLLSASEEKIILRLPECAPGLGLALEVDGEVSDVFPFNLASRLAADLHPVANPVIAPDGSLVTTVSGSRGEQVDQPLVRITPAGDRIPYSVEMMNPTGLAFSPDGQLYISCRNDGTVLRYTDFERLDVVAEDLGIPCGLVFDSLGNLYVGDRTGTIHRLDPAGRRKRFATLEPSISAFHLAIDAQDRVYVTGPTFALRDSLYRISTGGEVQELIQGLARPQGMAFLPDGDLLVAAGYRGKKGIFRCSAGNGAPGHFIAAPVMVGVARAGRNLYLADSRSIFRVSIPGTPPVN